MVLLILFEIIVVLTIILWLYSSPFYWKRKGVPYLWSWPLFGSTLPSFTGTLLQSYHKLYLNYPNENFFGFHFLTRPSLMLKDPKIIKDIFIRDFEHFSATGYYSDVDYDSLGSGISFQYGEAWKQIRSKLTNFFTVHKVRKSIQEYVEKSMKKFDETINKSIECKKPVEIDNLLCCLTTDIIMQAVYGVETDCFNKNSYFNEMNEELFNPRMNLVGLLSLVEPKITRLFKMKLVGSRIPMFFENLFKDVLAYSRQNKLPEHELIRGMVKLLGENQENCNGKERHFPDNTRILEFNETTVNAQMQLLAIGGIETTALVMSFFIYELAVNQTIQEKCRQEILDVLNENGTEIQANMVQKFTYLGMAIEETLRKYPPIPILPRRCTKRYQFRDTDITIDPGTVIILPIRSIQWDPKYYPEPEKFIPERFSNENKTNLDQASFLAFGFGPRSCVAMNFAKLEMLLVLSKLLIKYRFTVSPKTNIPIKFQKYAFATKPDPCIWVYAEPIMDKSDERN